MRARAQVLVFIAAVLCAQAASAPAAPAPIARVTVKIAVPDTGELNAHAGSLWVTSGATGRLSQIDPKTNKVVARVAVGATDAAVLAVGSHGLWISDRGTNSVLRVNPLQKQVVARIRVGQTPAGLVDAYGAVWVANEHSGSISRIDPDTNRVTATIRLEPPARNGPLAVAAAAGAIWVSVPNRNEVVRIAPATSKIVKRIRTSCGGNWLLPSGQLLLAGAGCGGRAVAAIDVRTNRVVYEREMPDVPGAFRAGFGSFWSVTFGGTLLRVDPGTVRVTGRLRLSGYDTEGERVVASSGALWVRVRGRVLRLAPAR